MTGGYGIGRALVAGAAVLLVLAAALPARAADRLEAMFRRYMEAEKLPGAVLLVSGPSGRRVLAGGVADLRTGTPVTPDTRFYVASVGKMPLAVMVLQQVEEGRYRLDLPVAPLVSDLPGLERVPNVGRATVTNLLNHTSGIPEYFTDAFEAAAARQPDRVWTAEAALAFAWDQPATGRVGGKHEYTNTNFLLLGHAVARTDGGTLADSFRRRIFQRAGMTATTVGADPADPSLAHGYTEDGGRLKDVSLVNWNSPLGDGALTTTAADLERFLFATFRDTLLLSPAMLSRMATPSVAEAAYGLGLELYEDDNGHCLYHSGHVDGFNAEIAYYVEQATVIVFLTNGDGVSQKGIADEAISRAAAIVIGH